MSATTSTPPSNIRMFPFKQHTGEACGEHSCGFHPLSGGDFVMLYGRGHVQPTTEVRPSRFQGDKAAPSTYVVQSGNC